MSLDDVARVQLVGVDANERFRELPDARIAACADYPSWPADELRVFADEGRAWVVAPEGVVVGYVLAEVVDGCGHIEELAVARSHANRGLGTALIDAVDRWARRKGMAVLTLTTFRDVAWNRPFYERREFRVLRDDDITVGLRAKVVEEEGFGLPSELRVVMRRDITSEA